MVQRFDDEEDLGRRFSRIEQIKLERRRREKFAPPPSDYQDIMYATERCRRVLFEPDTNLQGWIDGELRKIADTKKAAWNFDFVAGKPANIQNHRWNWQINVVAASAQNPAPAPMIPPPANCSPPPTAALERSSLKSAPRSASVPRAPKIRRRVNADQNEPIQTKITDYLPARKYADIAGSSKGKLGSIPSNDSSEDENPPDGLTNQ